MDAVLEKQDSECIATIKSLGDAARVRLYHQAFRHTVPDMTEMEDEEIAAKVPTKLLRVAQVLYDSFSDDYNAIMIEYAEWVEKVLETCAVEV